MKVILFAKNNTSLNMSQIQRSQIAQWAHRIEMDVCVKAYLTY